MEGNLQSILNFKRSDIQTLTYNQRYIQKSRVYRPLAHDKTACGWQSKPVSRENPSRDRVPVILQNIRQIYHSRS